MPEDPAITPPESTRCPWCSTVAPAGATTCSSCGAALIASSEGSVPGVTSIDAEAVLRGRTTARPRGGLLGLLSGETGDTVDAPSAAELSSLAPPPVSVRMEMIRLELDAERQRLEAEAAGMAADAVVDGEISRIPPGVLTPQPSDAASPNGSTVAEDTSASQGAPTSEATTKAGTAATPTASAAPAGSPAPGASPAPGPTSAGDGTPDSGASAVR
jgi:hypothetical protein